MKKQAFIAGLFLLIINLVNAQTLNYYFGNLHSHSSYSDGNKDSATSLLTKPIQNFNYAKNSQHIDFYGISEHNHLNAGLTSPTHYHQGARDAKAATVPGTFIALYGMEYGVISNGGHVIVYGYDSLLLGWDNNDYDVFNSEYNYTTLWKTINKKPSAFACLAHPANTDYDSLFYKPYNASFDSAIVGIPYKSGPAFSTNTTYSDPATSNYMTRYTDALKRGYHVGIGLDHDTHNSVFGRQTAGRLVIMAPALTEIDLFDAMKSMHFYGSDDWNAKVNFTLNGQVMGSVITHSGTATLSVTVTDPDGENVSAMSLYYGVPGSGIAATVLTSNSSSNSLTYMHALANATTYYYYLKITQSDGNVIYTSPIWYTRNDAVTQYQPAADFTASGTDANCIQTFTLTDLSTNSPNSWLWNLPGGNPSTSTLQNPVVTYTTSGSKNITLIASNAGGSSAAKTNTVSSNGCVGISELNGVQFIIYPNPANEVINISNHTNIKIDVKLFDMMGKEITSASSQNALIELNVKNITEGIYNLKISDYKLNSVTKLIVVTH